MPSLLQQFGPKDFQTNMSNTIFNQLGMVVFALHETATSLLDCNQQIWAHNLHSLPLLRKKLESVLKIFDTVISTKNFTKDHNTLFEKMTMPNLPLNHSTRPINHQLSVLENLSKKFALSGKSSQQESSNGENPLKRRHGSSLGNSIG